MIKKRLDTLVLEHYPKYSKTLVQQIIKAGHVLVNGHALTKPGVVVSESAEIKITAEEPKYVSRAGLKLEKALDYFSIDLTNKTALDAGISTGGFTDCLLQNNIKKVYGIEVGSGQTDSKIAQDPRVKIYEHTNLRSLTWQTIGEQVDLITLDLSFIPVTKVLEAVNNLLKPHGELIILIKPQFELTPEDLPKTGVIINPSLHKQAINKVIHAAEAYNFTCLGVIESPIKGGSGNKEFLAYFKR